MYTQRSKYWPAYTWKIQTSYSNEIKGNLAGEAKISPEEFEKLYFYIFDKVNSSFYHLQRLKENEDIALEIGNAMSKIKIPGTENMIGIAGVPYEPIGYEYESFLIKVKTTLDLIATLIAKCIGRKEDEIKNLQKKIRLEKSDENSLESKFYILLKGERFNELIESFKNPSKDKRSKRNFATHIGSLPTGTINIPINNPHASVLLSKVYDPNDDKSYFPSVNSPNLVDYCENQFYQTCDLLIESLSILVNKKIASGERMSLYETRKK